MSGIRLTAILTCFLFGRTKAAGRGNPAGNGIAGYPGDTDKSAYSHCKGIEMDVKWGYCMGGEVL